MYDNDFGEIFAGGIGAVLILFVVAIFLIPYIFYLLTLQNTLKAVSPELRKMPPANVWLLFIPLFNLIWNFFVVAAIADSLKAEYAKRSIPVQEERPCYGIGLTMAILRCCTIIPFLGALAGLGWLVCWIIFWVKVSEHKNKLAMMMPPVQ